MEEVSRGLKEIPSGLEVHLEVPEVLKEVLKDLEKVQGLLKEVALRLWGPWEGSKRIFRRSLLGSSRDLEDVPGLLRDVIRSIRRFQ